MAKLLRHVLIIMITLAAVTAAGQGQRTALAAEQPYLGSMLLYQGEKIAITATGVTIKITDWQALVTCNYELVNRGTDQTITALYPTGSAAPINGFAAQKNGEILPVTRQSLTVPAPGSAIPQKSPYYNFSFSLRAGEATTITTAYLVPLPFDDALGKYLHYDTGNPGGWINQGTMKVDISITDFKPYYNMMFFPEQGASPQIVKPKGSFAYVIEPGGNRQNINLYYQLRGPEAAWHRMATSRFGNAMFPFMVNKDYVNAYKQLELISNSVVTEGIISPNELLILKAFLNYEQQSYSQAAEELGRIGIRDGAYIYYQILTSLELKNQAAAGQSLQAIGQLGKQDLTGVSTGLLQEWAENTISQYLAQPAAPVPPTTDQPKQRPDFLLITMGLIVTVSIAITVLMRRRNDYQ